MHGDVEVARNSLHIQEPIYLQKAKPFLNYKHSVHFLSLEVSYGLYPQWTQQIATSEERKENQLNLNTKTPNKACAQEEAGPNQKWIDA
jgi:hypothetical protein